MVEIDSKEVAKLEESSYMPDSLEELPDVPLLKIFSYLDVKDRLICSRVCKKWSELIFTPSVWRTLKLVHKDEKGKCDCELSYYDSPFHVKAHSEKAWILLDGGYIRIIDEINTDVPGSFWKAEMLAYKKVIGEYKLLIGCLESVLPKLGSYVRNLSLVANRGLSDYIFNLYLIMCPNVEHLDARHTSISSDAFRHVNEYGSCLKIRSLNLMGCKQVTDDTLCNLAECWNREPSASSLERKMFSVPYTVQLSHYVCAEVITSEDIAFEGFFSNPTEVKLKNFTSPRVYLSRESTGLKYLCLAGCTKITDKGLQFLADCKFISDLEVLDVSGCSGLTSAGLNVVAKVCPKLKADNLFYCDMIYDGPFYQEANGCLTEGGVCCMN